MGELWPWIGESDSPISSQAGNVKRKEKNEGNDKSSIEPGLLIRLPLLRYNSL